VTLTAASVTFATFAVAEAATQPARTAAAHRHDPAPVQQEAHDLDGPLSKTRLDGLAGGLQPEAFPGPLLRHRHQGRVAEEVLREAVLGPLPGFVRSARAFTPVVKRT
jgi:immune inhibitor A